LEHAATDSSDKILTLESNSKTQGKKVSNIEKEYATLSTKYNALTEELEDIKARNRRHNIEISGLPQPSQEYKSDQIKKVINIAQKLGVTLLPSDIRDIHRIPTYKAEQPQPLIVSFISVIIRNEILDAYYEAKKNQREHPLCATMISSNIRSRIFLATHLTPAKKLLFKKLREKKQAGVKFVLERNGQLYAKVDETSRVIKINRDEDLQKLCDTRLS